MPSASRPGRNSRRGTDSRERKGNPKLSLGTNGQPEGPTRPGITANREPTIGELFFAPPGSMEKADVNRIPGVEDGSETRPYRGFTGPDAVRAQTTAEIAQSGG